MADADEAKQSGDAATEEKEGSLLDQIMDETRLNPSEFAYDMTKRGVEYLVAKLAGSQRTGEKIDKSTVDRVIAELDAKLSQQMDQVLHHEAFQKLESAWRGLKYTVEHTDFRENIIVEMLNVTKEDMLDDFEDYSGDVTKSGLYRHAYTAEYGVFGGQPVGAIIGNYEFSQNPQDMKLLGFIASVSAMSHAPFIAAASPKFFKVQSIEELPNLKDIKSILEGPEYAKWHSFRESEDARYVGLTLPRFLIRYPYGEETNPVRSFKYEENVHDSHEHYLWANTSFAFITRLTESFAKYRWCPNIIGPQSGGAVLDLPVYTYDSMGRTESKIPTEVLISDRKDFELSDEGFIPLTMRKGSDNACFFSANSAQKPKFFGNTPEGKDAETNYKLSTQLPYMFVINRLAHYIKVLQREQIGSWKNRTDLERELNTWIKQYMTDMDNPTPLTRSKRPLRKAAIKVEDVEGDPGWYRVAIEVMPHFKYMGASFTLSLKGKLDAS